MVRADREFSLKQGQPLWKGLTDVSTMAPASGMFQVLRNGILSQDGSEIVTAPGCRRSGRPFYLDVSEDRTGPSTLAGFGVKGDDIANDWITLNRSHALLAEVAVENDTLLYVHSAPSVSDGYYMCSRVNPLPDGRTTVQINGDVVNTSNGGAAMFCRTPISSTSAYSGIYPFHGMAQVGDYIAIVAKTKTADGDGTTTYEHVATWVSDGVLSFDSPEERWPCWLSPNNMPYAASLSGLVSLPDNNTATPVVDYVDMPIRRRGMLDVTNDDLLFAAPGTAACLQVNASVKDKNRAIVHATKLLGVPVGYVESTTAQTSGGSLADGTYYVSAGYRDLVTGRYGLPSDPVQVTVSGGGGSGSIDVKIRYPRTQVREFVDHTFVLYASSKNAANSAGLRIVKEDDPLGTGRNLHAGGASHTITITTTTTVRPFYPRIEQFPPGATWIKTVRGITYGGGMIGSALVDDSLNHEQLSAWVSAAEATTISLLGTTGSPPASHGRLMGFYRTPNNLAGFEFYLGDGDTTIGSGERMRLIEVSQDLGASQLNDTGMTWDVEPAVAASWPLSSSQGTSLYLLMPRGMIWHTELGEPGISPAINRIIRDRLQGRDFVSAARVGQSLLLLTEKETYLLSWARSPLGEDPVLLSDTYGCIAPNSVVEFGGTAAWLSDLGPVYLNGNAVTLLGDRIPTLWKTFKRDSRGMMLHAQGVHDPERRLVVWFIRTDYDTAETLYSSQADDDDKSFFPNDEALVWNYAADAFQTMRYASGRWISVSARCRHDDGFWRTAFVSNVVDVSNTGDGTAPTEFFDVYSMDDDYVDHRDQPLQKTATEAPYTTGGTTYFVASSGDFTGVRSGDQAFIRTGDSTLNWQGTVGSVTTKNATDDAIAIVSPPTAGGSDEWASGAIIEIGVMPPMKLTSHSLHLGSYSRMFTVESVTLRHNLSRDYPAASTFHGWAKVTLTNEDGDTQTFHDETYGAALSGSQTKLDRGQLDGNDIEVDVEVYTDGRVALKDIVLEVNQGR